MIALPSFVLGCPALNRWLPRDLCPLPLPLLLVLLRFQGHLNSNPTSRKERRSGDLGAIGAPLGTKEIRISGVPLAPASTFFGISSLLNSNLDPACLRIKQGDRGPTEFKLEI